VDVGMIGSPETPLGFIAAAAGEAITLAAEGGRAPLGATLMRQSNVASR
jgi:hypothetical protein